MDSIHSNELTRFYLLKVPMKHENLMKETSFWNIMDALDEYWNKTWTWEIADEKIIETKNGTNVMTTVTLYVPNGVYTGRSYCKIEDYFVNHLFALVDASKRFMDTKEKTQINSVPQDKKSMTDKNSMTAEQIAMLTGGNIESKAQLDNYTDSQGRPESSVPWNNITEQGMKDVTENIKQEMVDDPFAQFMNPPVTIEQPQHPVQQVQPKKYTQEQIDAMQAFKKEQNITTDEEFARWVNSWDKKLTSKKDITPDNIDEFIEWTKHVGE